MTNTFYKVIILSFLLLNTYILQESLANSIGDPVEIILENISDVTCNGGEDGTITISINGGIAPFAINWSTGELDVLTVNNLSAGTVSVTVTDNIGETDIATFTISEPDPILISFTNVGTITCNTPQANISVAANGGNGNFSFNWSNGASGSSINVSNPGLYTVTVTDIQGCTNSNSTTVNSDFIPPNANAGPDQDILCFNDNIQLSGSGPTGSGFTISWTTTDGNIVSGGNTYSPTVNSGGTYVLTVTDQNNGCSSSDQVVVTDAPDELSISLDAEDVTCFDDNDGMIAASVTGGTPNFSFNWSNGESSSSISGLAPGNYSVTVTDDNGCTMSASESISQPNELTVVVTTIDQSMVDTNDGSATATPSGGTGDYDYLWSTGSTAPTINNLAPGSYTVTVTDENGCTSTGVGVVLEVVCNLEAMIEISNSISCFGGDDGSLTSIASGGNGSISYTWSTGSSSPSINNLGAGNYELTVSDEAGCTLVASQTLSAPSALNIDLLVTPISGVGENDGAITSNVTGGTPTYSYLWSNGSTSSSIDNLGPGSYSVTVTDANGCTITSSASINEIDCDISVSINQTSMIMCFGLSTGALTANVSGQDGNVMFNWSNGATTASIADLPAGNYSVTVEDGLGCLANTDFTITEPPALSVDLQITEMSGPESNDGSITSSVEGGTPQYSYLWNNGATTPSINNLEPGVYTLTVSDDNGCSIEVSGEISEIDCNLEVAIAVLDDIDCFGDENGSLTAVVIGGEGNVSLEWNTGSTDLTLNNLGAGNYSITATDELGCTDEASIELNQPAPLDITFTILGISGVGENDGSIAADVSGGSAPFSFEWSNGSTGNQIDNLEPGTYSLTVTDFNGCVITSTATINEIDCTLAVDIEQSSEILCFGASTGGLNSITSGNQGNVLYSWSNGENTANISNLSAGLYSLTVSDELNCLASADFTINEPTALSAELQITEMSGADSNDGAITSSVSGGTPQYSYEWSNGASTPSISNLEPGVYTLTVTDDNGCSFEISGEIPEIECNLEVTIVLENDIDCFGNNNGSISASTIGGEGVVVLEWNNGSTDALLDNLMAGSYSVTATDALGCTDEASFDLIQPAILNVNLVITGLTGEDSNDGSITTEVTGGTTPYSYEWNNGSTNNTIENLEPGMYSVTVTDANGCAVSANGTINDFNCQVNVELEIEEFILCFGDSSAVINSTVINGDMPFVYAWNNGDSSNSLNNVPAGTYSITVTDDNSCVATSSIVVSQPAAIEFNLSVTQLSGPESNDGSIALESTGGTGELEIVWSTGEVDPVLADLDEGTYCFTITDNNGCAVSDCITIEAYDCDLNIEADDIMPVSCFGGTDGSVVFMTSGGTAPIAFDLGEEIDPLMLASGEYVVTATDAVGCIATDTFFIEQPDQLVISIVEFTPEISVEGAGLIEISVSGGIEGYNITWLYNGEDEIFDGLVLMDANSGEYTIIVEDENGCETSIELTINLQLSTIDFNGKQSISVYPNPASDFIYIDFEGIENHSNIHYIIYGTDGKVYNQDILSYNNNNIFTLDIVNLPVGIYFLQVTIDNQSKTAKLVKH